ncbi:hypothetical protein [Roseovarius spongiae]|uniref:hypothetical protein n=1 Tax=Roseovarius spongiae TaxID=2320272 RepID=UPI001407B337|nr:hypothetical protein [Roseovarius spongiae]
MERPAALSGKGKAVLRNISELICDKIATPGIAIDPAARKVAIGRTPTPGKGRR